MKTPEEIADELVNTVDYNGRIFWVKFGKKPNTYKLMYDSRYVADSIASYLRQMVIDSIEMSK
jgi:hypothetical protein